MANSKKQEKPAAKRGAAAPEEKIEGGLIKAESFIERYSKQLLIILIAACLVVGGYFAYKHFIAQPRVEKAAESMFVAEQLFAQGDFQTALNGDGSNAGFIEVVENYGGTRPGRIAAHYAGICFLKEGNLDSALEYLSKYKTAKGAPAQIINAQNYGLQGDVYSQKDDYAKASDFYKKAIDAADNILTTPYFLKKQGEIFALQGNNQAALDAFNRIKNEYGNSLEARDIDKLIGAVEQK